MPRIDVESAEKFWYDENGHGRTLASEHRWYRRYVVVAWQDRDGLWGFHYDEPATEMQEDQDRFPEERDGYIELFPVIAKEVTVTVYERAS